MPSSTPRPTPLPQSVVLLFAAACAMSVANVYYAQPLLDALSAEFAISTGAVGAVMFVTQLGCALALVLLVPLGDRVRRKPLMLVQAFALMLALAVVGLSSSVRVLLGAMLMVGLLGTALTQGLIAYAATACAANERGRVVGTAQAGVLMGLLLARVVAGVIADAIGWRGVYFCSGAVMLLLLLVLGCRLPPLPATSPELSYGQLLLSMGQLLRRQPVLQIRGVLAMLLFAAFNIFWNALVLPLSAAPYHFSHTAIGAFGLLGVVGALAASGAGRLADRGLGQYVTGLALILLLLAWLPLAWLPWSLSALMIGIVLLDLAGQAIHVINQNMIFNLPLAAHSRLVGCYMLFYSAGSGLGALGGTRMYAEYGWNGVCLTGAMVSALALLFWLLTLPARAR